MDVVRLQRLHELRDVVVIHSIRRSSIASLWHLSIVSALATRLIELMAAAYLSSKYDNIVFLVFYEGIDQGLADVTCPSDDCNDNHCEWSD